MTTIGRLYREKMVNCIKKGVEDNSSVFLLKYTSVSSNGIGDLRKGLRGIGADVYVARNSLTKIAFKEMEKEQLADKIEGQTAVVWSNEDSVEISKLLKKFEEEFEGVTIQGGLLQERVLEQADIKRLADLPSKNVLRGQLLGIIQAPITRLLGTFNAKSRDLLSVLKQLSEKKGGN